MNFRLNMSGCRFARFDDCVKFISYSAHQSDYIVSVKGYKRLSPFSPYYNEIKLNGSAKQTYKDIILDMDNVIEKCFGNDAFLSPEILEIKIEPDGSHYWGMLGAFFKIVGDISPAYVTGFLLENHMKKELEIFNNLYSGLPAPLQAALNEFMQNS